MASSPVILPGNDGNSAGGGSGSANAIPISGSSTATVAAPGGPTAALGSMFVVGSPRDAAGVATTPYDGSDYYRRTVLISGTSSSTSDETQLHLTLTHFGEVEQLCHTEQENVYSVTFRHVDSVHNLLSRAPIDKAHALGGSNTFRVHSLAPTANGGSAAANSLHEVNNSSENVNSGGRTNGVSSRGGGSSAAASSSSIAGRKQRQDGGGNAKTVSNVPTPQQQSAMHRTHRVGAAGGGGGLGNPSKGRGGMKDGYGQLRGPPVVMNYPPGGGPAFPGGPSGSRFPPYAGNAMPVKVNPGVRSSYNGAAGGTSSRQMPPQPLSNAAAAAQFNAVNSSKGGVNNASGGGGSGGMGPNDAAVAGGLPFVGSAPSASPLFFKENYPTRILVNNDLIGAIIGRSGEKIKEITSATGARVDVKREVVGWCQYKGGSVTTPGNGNHARGGKDSHPAAGMLPGNAGMMNAAATAGSSSSTTSESQIVFIYGSPENTSLAIRRIMDICMKEAENANHTEKPHLGLLTEDRFCGRIIGKEGKNLNTIREETGAIVYVSNSPIVTQLLSHPHQFFTLDRIIDIRGGLDAICKAEDQISAKLRLCHRHDLQRGQSPATGGVSTADMFPGGGTPAGVPMSSIHQAANLGVNHPISSQQLRGSGLSRMYPTAPTPSHHHHPPAPPHHPHAPNTTGAVPHHHHPGVGLNAAGPYPYGPSSSHPTHAFASVPPPPPPNHSGMPPPFHPHAMHGGHHLPSSGGGGGGGGAGGPGQQHPHHPLYHSGPNPHVSSHQQPPNVSSHYRPAGPPFHLHHAAAAVGSGAPGSFVTTSGGPPSGMPPPHHHHHAEQHHHHLQHMMPPPPGGFSLPHPNAPVLMYGSPPSHSYDNGAGGPPHQPPPSHSSQLRSAQQLLESNVTVQGQAANVPPTWVIHHVLGEGVELDDALYMRIPHVSAGAVIGTDGASIKKIMDDTKTMVTVSKVEGGAGVQQSGVRNKQCSVSGGVGGGGVVGGLEGMLEGVEKPQEDVKGASPDTIAAAGAVPPTVLEKSHFGSSPLPASMMQRKVIIKGSPGNQMKAQWHIFQRVKNSSRQSEADVHSLCPIADSDLCLWTIVRVPRALVGRIIGKGGRTVYNIQSSTGTIINLPKDMLLLAAVPPTTTTTAAAMGHATEAVRKRKASSAESGHSDELSTATNVSLKDAELEVGASKLTVEAASGSSGGGDDVEAVSSAVVVPAAADHPVDELAAVGKKLSLKGGAAADAGEANAFFQPVEIFGTFENTQLALGRIRALVNQALIQLYHQGQTLENCPHTQTATGGSHSGVVNKSAAASDPSPSSSPFFLATAEEDNSLVEKSPITTTTPPPTPTEEELSPNPEQQITPTTEDDNDNNDAHKIPEAQTTDNLLEAAAAVVSTVVPPTNTTTTSLSSSLDPAAPANHDTKDKFESDMKVGSTTSGEDSSAEGIH